MFIKKGERIAVTADGVVDEKDITPETDVIFIKPKMDFGTRQRYTNALVAMDFADGKSSTAVNIGSANIALLQLNIVAWRGPSFAGVALSDEAIEMLDQDEPIVERVLEELNTRNNKPKASPNTSTSNSNG